MASSKLCKFSMLKMARALDNAIIIPTTTTTTTHHYSYFSTNSSTSDDASKKKRFSNVLKNIRDCSLLVTAGVGAGLATVLIPHPMIPVICGAAAYNLLFKEDKQDKEEKSLIKVQSDTTQWGVHKRLKIMAMRNVDRMAALQAKIDPDLLRLGSDVIVERVLARLVEIPRIAEVAGYLPPFVGTVLSSGAKVGIRNYLVTTEKARYEKLQQEMIVLKIANKEEVQVLREEMEKTKMANDKQMNILKEERRMIIMTNNNLQEEMQKLKMAINNLQEELRAKNEDGERKG